MCLDWINFGFAVCECGRGRMCIIVIICAEFPFPAAQKHTVELDGGKKIIMPLVCVVHLSILL